MVHGDPRLLNLLVGVTPTLNHFKKDYEVAASSLGPETHLI